MCCALVIVAMFSSGLAVYEKREYRYPVCTFYLAQLRAWELLTGGILALKYLSCAITSKKINTVLGLIGIFMIGFPVFLYTDKTPFPGLTAIPPVLGTALVIFSSMTEKSLAGKFLGARPLVFVGVISYSLYLWHWPLIVFAKYYLICPMNFIRCKCLDLDYLCCLDCILAFY